MTEIKQQNDAHGGKFEVFQDGRHAGMMTYRWAGSDKFIIDHTEVDAQYNGLGLGKKLVEAAVDFARKEGVHIVPLCPFARAVLSKNEDWKNIVEA